MLFDHEVVFHWLLQIQYSYVCIINTNQRLPFLQNADLFIASKNQDFL